MKVAAAQMTSGASVSANLSLAGELASQARSAGADLLALPENFAFMGLKDADKLAVAEEEGAGPIQTWLSETARQLSLWIIGGTSFPANLKRDPRCAVGIVDWDPPAGRSQHVGFRGRAEVLPFDVGTAKTIFRKYFGPDEADWDRRFDDMVEHARGRGWVSADGSGLRVHIESAAGA